MRRFLASLRARRFLVDGVVEGLIALPVLVTLRYVGWAGRAPVAALVGSLVVGSALGNEALHRRFGGSQFDRYVQPRLALHVASAGAIVYLTGWGPVLAPAFVILLTLHLKWGAAAGVWRPMLLWSLLGVAGGQTAIAMGWVYSYVPLPGAHGMAILSALVLAVVMRLIGVTSEDREREVAERERQAAERDRAEQALQDSEQRFRALAHHASDVIVVTDRTGTGAPTYVSPSVERITGYTVSAFLAADRRALLHPADRSAMDTARAAVMAQPDGESRLELRFMHTDGQWHWHEVIMRNLADEPTVGGLVITFRDVTERRTLEEQIRHQAFHDSLTGLANRALFLNRLEHALTAQQRSGSPLALMLIDLDDFKAVNDSLGHLTGDELIVEVARSLSASVRPGDTVARLGGDEFAVLLEGLPTREHVNDCATRTLAALKRDFQLGDHRLPMTASIGVAVGAMDTGTAEELLRNADVAMYVAKAQGKGCFAVFEPGMHLAVHDRLQLKADLACALAAGDQMHLDYQPIVELATGCIVGVEALVRWNHPSRGRLEPDDFIPLAEESGLIIPLGRWVLTAACQQLASWRRRHRDLDGLYLSVNVSTGQLESLTLVEDVCVALRDTDVTPASLVIEITESALVRDMHLAERVLGELKVLGVRIAIDDFGTGHASFRYLQRFPVDLIKIDRCFVAGLGTDPHQAYFAEAMIKLAQGLKLGTIAEGVETPEDVSILRDLGCSQAQGFIFARPDSPETIEAILTGALEAFRVAAAATG
jgi:diguanylate cyclase (GGDEF)-like protein/PAS domain S-box-containing protein